MDRLYELSTTVRHDHHTLQAVPRPNNIWITAYKADFVIDLNQKGLNLLK